MKKKIKSWTNTLIILSFLFVITNSCKKDNNTNPTPTGTGQVAVLTKNTISSITTTTAICGGNITSDGGSTITARGVCWNKSINPSIADSKTTDGTGGGIFSSVLTGLSPNTTYYVRAYATNSFGTGYGVAMSFITLAVDDLKFSTDVYPIFSAYSCTACHGTAGGLSLSGTPSAVRTNLLVNAVVAGNSATSLLYTKFSGAGHQGISLTTTEVANIKGWIDTGAIINLKR